MGIVLALVGLVMNPSFEGFTKLSLWRAKSNPICTKFSTDAKQVAGGIAQTGPLAPYF
jgi:hypothetical protein